MAESCVAFADHDFADAVAKQILFRQISLDIKYRPNESQCTAGPDLAQGYFNNLCSQLVDRPATERCVTDCSKISFR
jgi:hypothetical protein